MPVTVTAGYRGLLRFKYIVALQIEDVLFCSGPAAHHTHMVGAGSVLDRRSKGVGVGVGVFKRRLAVAKMACSLQVGRVPGPWALAPGPWPLGSFQHGHWAMGMDGVGRARQTKLRVRKGRGKYKSYSSG